MKKIFSLIIIILLLVISISPNMVAVETMKVSGNTLYVGGNGPGNYTKIQDAIDNASDGDSVFVYNGRYYENVVVNKSIDLIGENRNTTIVDGGGHNDTILILSDNVNVSRFMITNSGDHWYYDAGIDVRSNSNTIMNNNINSHQENGILIWYSYNKVYKNIISNFLGGITTYYARNNLIYDNLIFNVTGAGYGIYLAISSQNIVSGNFIHDSNVAIQITESNCNIVCDNYADYNDNGMYLWRGKWNVIRDNTFSNSSYSSIEIEAFDNIVFHNDFINNGNPIDYTARNLWYYEYPFGGNYWDDYFNGSDDYHGPNQNLTGGDGIWDDPYIVSGYGHDDRYPFAVPNGWKNNKYGSNLVCFGSFNWYGFKPGSINNNTLYILNIGDYSSNLSWEIVDWPSWGTWTFTPSSGDGLKPEDGMTAVHVSVILPNEQNKEYNGKIKIVNKENSNDYSIISAYLSTSKAKGINILLFLQRLLEPFPFFEKILNNYYK